MEQIAAAPRRGYLKEYTPHQASLYMLAAKPNALDWRHVSGHGPGPRFCEPQHVPTLLMLASLLTLPPLRPSGVRGHVLRTRPRFGCTGQGILRRFTVNRST